MSELLARVLVTGADGFLGRTLVRHLKAHSAAVVAPSRSTGFDILVDAPDLSRIDHVFHLAARTGVQDSWQDPVGFHLVNAHGVVRLLDACCRSGCSMTYVSGFVYGTPACLPIAETDEATPNNPYAFSKLMGEEACRFYASTFGLRVNIVRPFNIYGPDQDERFVLPVIVNQLVDPDVTEIRVRDLSPRRDYIHVDDVVSAILAVARQPAGTVFNAGSGVSHSVGEIIEMAFRAAGFRKPVRSAEETRQNEIMDVVADTRALNATGWRPATGLEAGMAQLVARAQERLDRPARRP